MSSFSYKQATHKGATRMWLVTNYHPLGSLYDYLNRPYSSLILTPVAALKLLLTACRGLAHLHSEIHANQVHEAGRKYVNRHM